MISASLIASGLLSIVQMLHLRIPFTSKRIGTGILTIVSIMKILTICLT